MWSIFHSLTGIAGEICALMGPSGCGKTTLLNVLASRATGAQKVESTVLVNGTKPSRTTFREISCFVEQEDALIGSLTVRETLHFASRLASTRLARLSLLTCPTLVVNGNIALSPRKNASPASTGSSPLLVLASKPTLSSAPPSARA